MRKRELQHFIIEMATIYLKDECRLFSTYYKIDYISLEFDVKKDKADVYLIDHEEKSFLFTLDFEKAVAVLKNATSVISPEFDKVIEKYHLEDNTVFLEPQVKVVENNETETI